MCRTLNNIRCIRILIISIIIIISNMINFQPLSHGFSSDHKSVIIEKRVQKKHIKPR